MVVSDGMLGYNQKAIDPFASRVRHKKLDVYSLSQSCFGLREVTIRSKSNTKKVEGRPK